MFVETASARYHGIRAVGAHFPKRPCLYRGAASATNCWPLLSGHPGAGAHTCIGHIGRGWLASESTSYFPSWKSPLQGRFLPCLVRTAPPNPNLHHMRLGIRLRPRQPRRRPVQGGPGTRKVQEIHDAVLLGPGRGGAGAVKMHGGTFN